MTAATISRRGKTPRKRSSVSATGMPRWVADGIEFNNDNQYRYAVIVKMADGSRFVWALSNSQRFVQKAVDACVPSHPIIGAKVCIVRKAADVSDPPRPAVESEVKARNAEICAARNMRESFARGFLHRLRSDEDVDDLRFRRRDDTGGRPCYEAAADPGFVFKITRNPMQIDDHAKTSDWFLYVLCCGEVVHTDDAVGSKRYLERVARRWLRDTRETRPKLCMHNKFWGMTDRDQRI